MVDGIVFKTWVFNDNEVTASEENDDIQIYTKNKEGKITKEGITNRGNYPLAKRIENLKKSEIIDFNGSRYYSIPFRTFNFGTRIVSLHDGKWGNTSDILCHRYNTASKISYVQALRECLHMSDHCSLRARDYLTTMKATGYATFKREFLNRLNITYLIDSVMEEFDDDYRKIDSDLMEEQHILDSKSKVALGYTLINAAGTIALSLTLLPVAPLYLLGTVAGSAKTCDDVNKLEALGQMIRDMRSFQSKIYQKRKQAYDLDARPFLLEVEPQSAKSLIDPRVLVSEFQWAVTILGHRGSENNHASIFLEGFETVEKREIDQNGVETGIKWHELAHKIYQLHYSGGIRPIIHEFSPNDKIEFDRRMRTWKISYIAAKALYEMVEAEIKTDTPSLQYHWYGPTTSNPDVHNCLSWAFEKLRKANIREITPKYIFGACPYRLKNYTTLGKAVFVGAGLPLSLSVYYNNLQDRYDYSEENVKSRMLI